MRVARRASLMDKSPEGDTLNFVLLQFPIKRFSADI